MKNRFLVVAFLLLSAGAFAQVSYETNDPNLNPTPLGYLGWDDNSNTTLRVRQNDRVRIWLRDTTYNHVNDGALQNVTRMAIHQNTSTTGIPFPYASFQPASMLHIGKAIPQALVRSWMNIGTTYGVRHDGMYVGMYEVPDDVYDPATTRKADAVIAWGCNKAGTIYGPDNMRFIFIAPTNGAAGTGPDADDEGQEVGRFTPEGNFGIGNYYTNGIYEQPTERLDVDGTARLRQMPSEEFDVVITGVYATDPEVDGDFILNYSTIEDLTDGLIECDWDVIGNNVAMGFAGACVTHQMLVGSNTQTGTNAKAYMTKGYSGTTLRAEALVGDNAEIAGYFEAGNVTDTFAKGVFGEARNSRSNVGLEGWAHEASVKNHK